MKTFHYFSLSLACAMLGMFACLAAAADGEPATQHQIDALVKQLGADEYAAREAAQRELAKIGQAAFDALFDAQDSDDVEISLRSRYLLRLIQFTWVRETDSESVKMILKDYDSANERLQYYKMGELARLPEDGGVEALCRLVRFEKSNKRSKYAALQIVRMESKDEKPLRKTRGETILNSLGRSRRAAANWLRTYVETSSMPAVAVEKWSELVAKEQKTLDLFPAETDRTLIATMMQHQVDMLQRLGRREQSLEVMRNLFADYVDAEREDTLIAMVNWLVQKRAWSMIDEVAKQYDRVFSSNPLLLYTLAQARLAQEAPDEAEKLADQAIKMRPGKDELSLRYHLILAHRLQERDLLHWAEREFRHVIEVAPKSNEMGIMAQSELAYMMHDLERHKEAAEMLGDLVKLSETDVTVRAVVARMYNRPEALKARMHFYYSQHHRKQGEHKKQRAALDEALNHDKTDGDVLIALYELTKDDPQELKKTREKIKTATEIMLAKIKEEPDSATWYNQYAWLVANTEGDKELALKMSLKSIEIRPNSGGLLDTLAHCYFALGKYDKAVSTQQLAVQLESSSRTIRKKLDVFTAARDAAKKKKTTGT